MCATYFYVRITCCLLGLDDLNWLASALSSSARLSYHWIQQIEHWIQKIDHCVQKIELCAQKIDHWIQKTKLHITSMQCIYSYPTRFYPVFWC